METSTESTLPHYEYGDAYVTELGPSARRVKVQEVRCPRKGCREWFVVKVKAWTESRLIGRSCPYCFKASRR